TTHPNPPRPAPPAPGHQAATAPQPAELPVYTVRARDTLWRIAERHLGDGLRYHDIVTLNAGRPQPGGHHLTDDHIEPGCKLLLPAHATGPPTPAPPHPPPPPRPPPPQPPAPPPTTPTPPPPPPATPHT